MPRLYASVQKMKKRSKETSTGQMKHLDESNHLWARVWCREDGMISILSELQTCILFLMSVPQHISHNRLTQTAAMRHHKALFLLHSSSLSKLQLITPLLTLNILTTLLLWLVSLTNKGFALGPSQNKRGCWGLLKGQTQFNSWI